MRYNQFTQEDPGNDGSADAFQPTLNTFYPFQTQLDPATQQRFLQAWQQTMEEMQEGTSGAEFLEHYFTKLGLPKEAQLFLLSGIQGRNEKHIDKGEYYQDKNGRFHPTREDLDYANSLHDQYMGNTEHGEQVRY